MSHKAASLSFSVMYRSLSTQSKAFVSKIKTMFYHSASVSTKTISDDKDLKELQRLPFKNCSHIVDSASLLEPQKYSQDGFMAGSFIKFETRRSEVGWLLSFFTWTAREIEKHIYFQRLHVFVRDRGVISSLRWTLSPDQAPQSDTLLLPSTF